MKQYTTNAADASPAELNIKPTIILSLSWLSLPSFLNTDRAGQ